MDKAIRGQTDVRTSTVRWQVVCPTHKLVTLTVDQVVKDLNTRVKTAYWVLFNPLLYCFFGSEGHVALDTNPGPGYDTLLLRMIPGDLLSACPHRHFHTLPSLLDSRAALSGSYPNVLRAKQGGSLYHFYDGFWYDPTRRQTQDLQCEKRGVIGI